MDTQRGATRQPPAFSLGQRRVLEALGVPVYVRRALWPLDASTDRARAATPQPTSSKGANTARAGRATPRPEPTRRAPRQAAGGEARAPRYALSFAQLGKGVLVCDHGGVPTGHFARDVALALGSEVRTPQVNNLEWPGRLPAAMAADPAAASEAARGLLDGMLDGLDGAIVLLLGEQAVRHLVVPALGDVAPAGQAQVAGNRWYWNVENYRLAKSKRALWRFLQGVNGQQ